MAKTALLTVTTDVGTFTRRTARTYTHIVVVGPFTDAHLADENTWRAANPLMRPLTKNTHEGVWGWCGRLDLAHNAARQAAARCRFEWVRVYDLAGNCIAGGN